MSKKLTYKIHVRLVDLDINKHVNNSVYFTYMEEARTQLLYEQYHYCESKGIAFVVAETSCKYKRSITYGDSVLVEILITDIKSVSFNVFYTLKNDQGKIYAEGTTRIACLDEKTLRPVRIPQEIINSIK